MGSNLRIVLGVVVAAALGFAVWQQQTSEPGGRRAERGDADGSSVQARRAEALRERRLREARAASERAARANAGVAEGARGAGGAAVVSADAGAAGAGGAEAETPGVLADVAPAVAAPPAGDAAASARPASSATEYERRQFADVLETRRARFRASLARLEGPLREAVQALADGASAHALERLEKARAAGAQDPELARWLSSAYCGVAQLRLSRGDLRGADEQLDAAERADPTDPLPHALRGLIARRGGDSLACTRSLGRAAELEAADGAATGAREPFYRYLQAACAAEADDLDTAVRAYDGYLELAPRDEDARSTRERLSSRERVEADFERVTTAHFEVKYDVAARALVQRTLLPVLESAWRDTGRTLGHFPEQRFGVVVYADRAGYTAATGAPDWMGALFDGRIRIPVDPENTPPAVLERIVRHELVHVVLRDLAGRRVPQWLHEGLAQYMAGEQSPKKEETYRLFARNRTWVPIRSIEDSFAQITEGGSAGYVYDQCLSMVDFLFTRWGQGGVEKLIARYAAGDGTEAAMTAALGISLDAFHEAWFAELVRRYE